MTINLDHKKYYINIWKLIVPVDSCSKYDYTFEFRKISWVYDLNKISRIISHIVTILFNNQTRICVWKCYVSLHFYTDILHEIRLYTYFEKKNSHLIIYAPDVPTKIL